RTPPASWAPPWPRRPTSRWRHASHHEPLSGSNLPLGTALSHTVVTMVHGGRIPNSGEYSPRSTPTFDIADAFRWCTPCAHRNTQDRKGVRGSDKVKPGNRRAGEADRSQDPRQEGSHRQGRAREEGRQEHRAHTECRLRCRPAREGR